MIVGSDTEAGICERIPVLKQKVAKLQLIAVSITTPLLVMHSETDLRCAIEQAEHIFSSRWPAGEKEVELVRFPAESHELTRSGSRVHRVMRFEILLD